MKSVRQALKDLGIDDLWDTVNKAVKGHRDSKNQDTKRKYNFQKAKARRKMAKQSRRINRGKKRKT